MDTHTYNILTLFLVLMVFGGDDNNNIFNNNEATNNTNITMKNTEHFSDSFCHLHLLKHICMYAQTNL